MDLRSLVEEYEDLTDEALQKHFTRALSEMINLAQVNPHMVRTWMEDGLLDQALSIEEEDGFGTEGLLRD